MARTYPTSAELLALAGSEEAESEIYLPDDAPAALGPELAKSLWALARAVAALQGCGVYQDGNLTYAVRAGSWRDGSARRTYAGSTANALTDDATNYVYLTLDGTLTVSTSAFPTSPHIPLAVISTGSESADATSGYYDEADGDLVDHRKDLLLAAADWLALSAAAEDSDEIVVTIQGPKDRCLVEIWVAATDMAAPDATGNTCAIDTGTQIEAVTANAHYRVLSDATGLIEFGVTVSGAATRYVMASLNGRTESVQLTFAA